MWLHLPWINGKLKTTLIKASLSEQIKILLIYSQFYKYLKLIQLRKLDKFRNKYWHFMKKFSCFRVNSTLKRVHSVHSTSNICRRLSTCPQQADPCYVFIFIQKNNVKNWTRANGQSYNRPYKDFLSITKYPGSKQLFVLLKC